MDILEEKEAFLNVYVNYQGDSRKIPFNEETEQFMWRKNNVSDTEVEYVHLMNQRWYAWLACAKSKAQAVPEGFVLVPKDSLKVALSWMNEDLDPWQMGGDSFAELYKHKPILEKAMVEAQEPAND